MKTRWLTAMFFSIALLLLSGTAQAVQWSCVHGSSGHIEFLDRVATLDRNHIGWGLDFTLSSVLLKLVHFAPPTILQQRTRYIALQFQTGSADAFIDSVHVYNLGTKVKEFDDLGWSGALQAQVLDLGSDMPFVAVGISVEVKAGVESMSHNIIFTGACASVAQ